MRRRQWRLKFSRHWFSKSGHFCPDTVIYLSTRYRCDAPGTSTNTSWLRCQEFDQHFAELISNVLYKQADLRPDICRGLQALVDSNKAALAVDADAELLLKRVTKADAQKSIDHLASIAKNMLAVLFNVYSETLPQYRGYILQCINSYLSIAPAQVRICSSLLYSY